MNNIVPALIILGVIWAMLPVQGDVLPKIMLDCFEKWEPILTRTIQLQTECKTKALKENGVTDIYRLSGEVWEEISRCMKSAANYGEKEESAVRAECLNIYASLDDPAQKIAAAKFREG